MASLEETKQKEAVLSPVTSVMGGWCQVLEVLGKVWFSGQNYKSDPLDLDTHASPQISLSTILKTNRLYKQNSLQTGTIQTLFSLKTESKTINAQTFFELRHQTINLPSSPAPQIITPNRKCGKPCKKVGFCYISTPSKFR